ncbi:beta-galactosidase [Entomomonas asaccharolytica]|uniref:Beta-galactosidase n=1 Tax=Entomomonas asaccharolytica TaxID=2785331 RepID=A0A974RY72_9GAMM|nr:beta-galactosidase [Entomomonas asaccharolytica]QQP86988.1 beta-galactosidase [Entomomonas asaccharolytica]
MLKRIVLLSLLCISSISLVIAEEQPLYDFLQASNKVTLFTQGVTLPNDGVEHNQQNEVLKRITFANDIDEPSIAIHFKQATNLINQKALSLRIQNAMDWDLRLYVDIKDTSQTTLLRATIALPAGPAQNLLIPLKQTSGRVWGMREGLSSPWQKDNTRYLLPMSVVGKLDTSKIASITLSMAKPAIPQSILISNIKAIDSDAEYMAYHHLLDKYGQNNTVNWPDKITSDKQLQQVAQAEQAQLEDWLSHQLIQDKFGGLDAKPQFKATGYFRTEKHNGRWYLVSPEGHAFISLGINTVVPDQSQTYITGREFMFASLPEQNKPLANYYGHADTNSGNAAQGGRGIDKGQWYDFYQANMYRVHGKDVVKNWRERTINRFKAWGFNTIGNWSDKQLIAEKRLPYTMPILIKGDYASVPSGMDWWGFMPDTFDPKFTEAVERAVKLATKNRVNDPWLVGYFADNELSWGGLDNIPAAHYALAINSLSRNAESPAKQAFIKQLKNKYKDIDKLANAWGVAINAWQDIEQQGYRAPLPTAKYPAISEDYSIFLTNYADNYFKTVKEMIYKYDPNHLFLGNRFAVKLPEVITSCAKYCDVISFNTYTLLASQGYDTELVASLDRPIMISEFTFGSKTTGALWSGPVAVADDKVRADSYQQFVKNAFEDPHMVGVHWFQYIDQPLTGRLLDGENGNMGLVAITDVPFHQFIKQVRQANLAVAAWILNKL